MFFTQILEPRSGGGGAPPLEQNAAFVDGTYGSASGVLDDPTKPFDTIQAAIDATADGDKIYVAKGAYSEAIDLGGEGRVFDGIGVTGITAINNVGSGTDGRLGVFEFGENYIRVHASESETQNWTNLAIAKSAVEGMTPYGDAIGVSNPAWIIVSNAEADGGANTLTFATDYVNLVGDQAAEFTMSNLTGILAPVLETVKHAGYVITSSAASEPIQITATHCQIENISVKGDDVSGFRINDGTNTAEGVVLRGCSYQNTGVANTYALDVDSDFDGLIDGCAFGYPSSTVSRGIDFANATVSKAIIRNSVLSHTIGAITFSGRFENVFTGLVTSGNLGFSNFAGEAIGSRFNIFNPASMSGKLVNCSTATQSLPNVSGECYACELSVGNGTISGTFYSCEFSSNFASANATVSSVFHGCRFKSAVMPQTNPASLGSWSAVAIGCYFAYVPYAQQFAQTVTKALGGTFQACTFGSFSTSDNRVPVVVGAKFIACVFRQYITPTEDAVFTACQFYREAVIPMQFASMVAPLRASPRTRQKSLSGTTCTIQVRCNYAANSAYFAQAGDTIEVVGVGFEYDGIFTVDSIAAGTNGGIALTYTNVNVTSDESETSVTDEYGFVTWVDYPNNRCRMSHCYFDEGSNQIYWGLGLSRHQPVYGDNNTFASGPFHTLTYDQEIQPYHQVIKGDASAVGEVSEIWVLSNAISGGEYIDLEDGAGTVRVWIDVDNGSTAPATPAGGRLLEVDVSSGFTASQITSAINGAINGDSQFSATAIRNLSLNQIRVVCLDGGDRTDVTTSASAIFGVRKIADGAADLTLTALPAANQQKFNLLNISGGNVILDGNGAETINGAATNTLSSQYDSTTYHSDGSNLFIE